MGILQRLGLSRPNKWEPPTILDNLLHAPLQSLAAHLYHHLHFLRGYSFNGTSTPLTSIDGINKSITVVCLSDTHDKIPSTPIPDGDLLIHCGDLTNEGTVADIQKQIDFLADLPHRHKIVIAGNHDSYFDPSSRKPVDTASGAMGLDLKGIHYLERSSVTLDFDDGRRLNLYGAPDIPRCGGDDNAFQYDRDQSPWAESIPIDTDVLITHTPPQHHLDLDLGCPSLLAEVWRVRPRLHVFGHVHWGRGREPIYFNDCQRAYESLMSRPKHGALYDLLVPSAAWLDLVKMVYYGVQSLLWKWLMMSPGTSEAACLMVNAAVMYGNTGKLRHAQVEVVHL